MISLKILISVIIFHLSEAVNVCKDGEIGYLSCTEKRALCITLDSGIFNYTCKCETGYEFNENSTLCIEKANFCSPGNIGYRYCRSEKANCRNDPTNERGFSCFCDEGKQRNHISEMCEEVANTAEVTVEPPNYSASSITEKQFFPTTAGSTDIPAEPDVHIDSTVSDKPFIPSDINPCSRNSCTENTTCIAIKDKYICECKIGFIPKPDYQILVKRCSGSCDTDECKYNCHNIKSKKECYKNLNERVRSEDSTDGWSNRWMISTIILCLFLTVTIAAIIYLIIRNYTLRNNLNDNGGQQLIYNKMETRQRPSEDLDSQCISFIEMKSRNVY